MDHSRRSRPQHPCTPVAPVNRYRPPWTPPSCLLISGSGVRNPDGALQSPLSGTHRLRGAVYAPLIASSRRSATWGCTLPRVMYTSCVMLTFECPRVVGPNRAERATFVDEGREVLRKLCLVTFGTPRSLRRVRHSLPKLFGSRRCGEGRALASARCGVPHSSGSRGCPHG